MMKNLTGKLLGHVFVLLFAALSFQATAATQAPGSDFNHATTGFALTGGHLAAACETCHIGGVFKGTPRNCDGCHAVGKRVVATPKSSSHIVTDAPCDTCHFNANTWLGARYNHGTAQPGGCQSCHNGRLSMTKPPSHNTGSKATNSCDQCHRTYAWLPATWNHQGGSPTDCTTGSGCHVLSSGNPYYLPGDHSTAVQYTTRSKASFNAACGYCHNYFSWSPAQFNHSYSAGPCTSCHTMKTGHIAVAAGAACGDCHRTRSHGWLPASVHTGNEAGQCRTCHATTPQPSSHTAAEYISRSCDVCHTSQTTWTGASGHIDLVPPHVPTCRSCHSNDSHDGQDGATLSMDCSRSGCHRPGGTEGRLFSSW